MYGACYLPSTCFQMKNWLVLVLTPESSKKKSFSNIAWWCMPFSGHRRLWQNCKFEANLCCLRSVSIFKGPLCWDKGSYYCTVFWYFTYAAKTVSLISKFWPLPRLLGLEVCVWLGLPFLGSFLMAFRVLFPWWNNYVALFWHVADILSMEIKIIALRIDSIPANWRKKFIDVPTYSDLQKLSSALSKLEFLLLFTHEVRVMLTTSI